MNRSLEARLSKLEQALAPGRLSHEDWLDLLGAAPLTEAEAAALDAATEAEAIAAHGSLTAAAVAYRAKANRSRDPLDTYLAVDMECRAGMERSIALA